jgi:hypothetical protein
MFRRLILVCVTFLGAFGSWADDLALVKVGEPWTYHVGTNAPPTAWPNPGFDDSAWQQGISGFGTSTSADVKEATLLLNAVTYHAVFLRHKFTVTDPTTVKWLILRLDYDDGFVAYLNGQEILRRGLTNNPVAFDDFADPHPGGAAEEFNVSNFANLLNIGDNLLAIEVHTAITNEPGNPNSVKIVPELRANFQRGPFLQNATTNSIQVIWRTPVPSDSTVEFGADQLFGTQISDSTLTTNHVMTVTNLSPGSQYFYRIKSSDGSVTPSSPTNSFHAFKASGDFSFLVLGDSGNGSGAQIGIAAGMDRTGADLVMHCGDVVYPDFTFGLEDTRCLSVYDHQMRSTPFYFVMGNHEVQNGLQGVAYLQTFYLPTNSAFGTEHFYSFDHGDAHFVAIYLPYFGPAAGMDTYKLYEGSAQYTWLTNDLASSTKAWKFLFLHHPLDTSGSHREDHFNGTQLFDWQVAQNILLPVARQYGAQVVFSGHDHDYERFNPVQGVQFVVNGGGGGDLNGMTDGRDPASAQFFNVPEFMKVTVQGNTMTLQAIDTNGVVFDYMTYQRVAPPPQTYQASWHTPLVQFNNQANDGHGNIIGQTFDFIGNPIPSLPGQFSNLGRVFVNNDSTNLFIGFEQPMFYASNNIFLFLEVTGQNGVSNLVGLGNGIADVNEGVDGLDFLENLAFTNFSPSVGVLVGDEFADGQFRTFFRSSLPLNIGQGVFRLDSGFSNLNGVRVQQFNRSPQVLSADENFYPEQNANYIEVAIPFDQLGGLRPGDTIKLAAIVGLAGFDTNAQTREIDSGYIGSFLSGSGQSNVVLGAVGVRLAPTVLNVTADNQSRAYGGTNPPLTFSFSGFVNGEDPSLFTGSPVLSTPATTNSPIGSYPISISPGTLSSNVHYSFSFVNGILTVTQAVLTLTADNKSRSYGDTNPVFTGTISGVQNNDLLVESFNTTAGPTSAVGSYAIVPSAAGPTITNYTLVTNSGSLAVTPAPLGVTADDKTRRYGIDNPPFTGSIVGIRNNDNITLACTSPAVAASPVGTYPIVAGVSGVASSNYTVSATNATLTISIAPLSVTADSQTRAYGQTNAPLTTSVTGFGNGPNGSILSGTPVLQTDADTNSPVGVYAINISQGTLALSDTNYTLVLVNGSLTVTQAALMVIADSQIRSYGSTNQPLTYELNGFVNGQGTNLMSGSPTLGTTADTNSPIGSYPITVIAGTLSVANTNYALVTVNGSITVTQANLIVIADNKNRTYGATNPVFTGTVSGILNNDLLTASYSTPATVTSSVGTYSIVPSLSGAGLTNYAVAATNGTLTITQALLSVTASNVTRPYGVTNPTLTGLIVGVLNNDPINASYNTAATPSSPVGAYPILPALSGTGLGNYSISTNPGILTVTFAPLSVHADNLFRGYGQTNPPLTVSYSGFGIGQDTNILSGSPVLQTSATTNSAVGTYDITVQAGTLAVSDTNYSFVFTNGTLTVTQAVLAVKADDKTRIYGSTNPIFTFTVTGFVNGQGTNILNGSPILTTTADTNSSVGQYAISAAQGTLSATDTNYGFVFSNGVLAITVASSSTLIVSGQNPSTNGDSVTFTATASAVPVTAPPPTGNVNFLSNGGLLGSAALTNGAAVFSSNLLSPGTNTVEADYAGDGNFLGSTNSLQQVVLTQCSSTNYVSSIVGTETNTFIITFIGTTHAQYCVLTTTNATDPGANWTILPGSTNTALNGLWSFAITNSGAAQFFRAQALLPCP